VCKQHKNNFREGKILVFFNLVCINIFTCFGGHVTIIILDGAPLSFSLIFTRMLLLCFTLGPIIAIAASSSLELHFQLKIMSSISFEQLFLSFKIRETANSENVVVGAPVPIAVST